MEHIKENITEYFKDLTFNEKEHKYFVNGKPINFSVSGIIKKYEEPFKADSTAERVALRKGKTKYEILAEWKAINKQSLIIGNAAHLFGEQYVFDRTLIPQDGYQEAIAKFWNDLPDYIIPVSVETRMYHKERFYAGTMDIFLYNTLNDTFIIADYKGLPLETDILTSNGWKTMETLSLEDKVFDKEGNLCNIKNISKIHYKKCLKIKFDNNEEIISDFEHRWLVHKGLNKKGRVMTTQEIKDYLDSKNTILSYNTLRIYNCDPIQVDNIKLPIDPYVFGLWLGDGHKIDGKITQMNSEVWEEVEKRGYKLGPDVSKDGSGKAQTRTLYKLQTELRKLGLIKNKHLPEIFILSSYQQKLDLLRGLMDADGYYNSKRKRFVITTTKQNQVDFSVQLLCSLGIKPTVIKASKYCNGKIIEGFDVCFTTSDFNPFLCRNKDLKLKTNNQNKYRRIVSVEEVEQVPTKCIEVDSPSHTFLCTKSLIVTHNTNKDLFKNFAGKKLRGKFSDLLDTPYSKYEIQLSYYQELIEQVPGIKISKRKIIWVKPTGEYELFDCVDYTERIAKRIKFNKRWS